MNRSLPYVLSMFLLAAVPLAAQNVCPCVPTSHQWIAKSCATWDCAASAFVLSNGAADTLVVPTANSDMKWVVLERVPAGSAMVSDPIFNIDSYDNWLNASLRFGTIDAMLKPMIVSSPDGRFLIVARNAPEPRRRAVVAKP